MDIWTISGDFVVLMLCFNIPFPREKVQISQLVLTIKESDIRSFYVAEGIAHLHQKTVLLVGCQVAEFQLPIFGSRRTEGTVALELAQDCFEVAFFNGFQQIVDAVYLESLDGIFVVGGGEDNGQINGTLLEYLKAQPVGQADIYNHQVQAALAQEQYSLLHALCPARQLPGRAQPLHHTLNSS